jgi:hypothetical protein
MLEIISDCLYNTGHYMDKIPKTRFINSPETEVERIVFTANVIANGFYLRKGFMVLPKLAEEDPVKVVVFPDLKYESIPNFWNIASKLKRSFPMEVHKQLFKDIEARLARQESVGSERLAVIQKEWEKVGNKFFEFMGQVFPKVLQYIENLEVRVTKFGTISSYQELSQKKGQHFIVYLREDAALGNLAEAILTGLFAIYKKTYWFSWGELESTVDLLLIESRISKLFPDYYPTVKSLKEVKPRILARSNNYLEKLGVVYQEQWLSLNGRRVMVKGKGAEAYFSRRELEVLRELIKREGELVSFDEAADLLWGEGEYKSLWALNKALQRLRTRLIRLGFPANKLRTVRKYGYLLSQG